MLCWTFPLYPHVTLHVAGLEDVPNWTAVIHCFEFRDQKTGLIYPNSPLIIAVELKKMPEVDDGTPMWPWLKFFRSTTPEEFETLKGRSEAMSESVTRLMEMSASKRERMRAESRDKFLWDQAALRRAGLAEGEAKKQTEIARQLLKMKMLLSDIASATGLSEAEVKRLSLETNS